MQKKIIYVQYQPQSLGVEAIQSNLAIQLTESTPTSPNVLILKVQTKCLTEEIKCNCDKHFLRTAVQELLINYQPQMQF